MKMERSSRCCLLACVLAICLGSLGVVADNGDLLLDRFDDDLFENEFTEDQDEATDVLQNLIDQYLGGELGDPKRDLRAALTSAVEAGSPVEEDQKRAGRCRGATKCIMRGPNPNTSSRVLPFGKRGNSPPASAALARRGRGSAKNSRARGGRTILPFGKRR